MTDSKSTFTNAFLSLFRRARRSLGYLSAGPFDVSTTEGRSKERYRLIVLSGAASTIAKAVTVVAGLFSMPLVLNHVGKDLFGLWAIVTSLVVWMQLFDFGIANGLSNALAEAHGRNDRAAASSYLSSAVIASSAIALVCLPLFTVACVKVPWEQLLNISNANLSTLTTQAFMLVGLAFIANIPLSLIGRVFIAHQRGYVVSISQAVAAVLTLGVLIVAVHLDAGFLWIIAIMSFGPVMANLALWFAKPVASEVLRIKVSHVSYVALSRVAASSIPLFVFQCGALLVNQLVNVVIVRTANLSMVTDFNVVLRIYLVIFSVAASLGSPFYPAIREAFEKRETTWVVGAIRQAFLVRFFVTVPFVICLLGAGDIIIKFWIGKDFATEIGFWGWVSVSICLLLSASSSLFSEILSSLDDIWPQVSVVMVSAATVLWLLTVLIPPLGVAGVFLSMAASTLYPIIWALKRITRTIPTP